MDWNFVLTIISIVVTIIFGIWAIFMAFSTSKKVQITYSYDKCVSLLNDISKGVSNLEIFFKDKPINDNLFLLQAYLINTGNKDITTEMIENKIQLCVPQDYNFEEVKIVSSTIMANNVKILNANTIEFDTGLWKVKEYIKFDALISIPAKNVNSDLKDNNVLSVNNLNDKIFFKHRIADSSKIRKVDLSESSSPFEKSSILMLIAGIILIFLTFLMPKFGLNNSINYKMNIDDKIVSVTAHPNRHTIRIKSDSIPKTEMTPLEFSKAFNGEVELKPDENKFLQWFAIIYLTLGLLLLVLNLFLYSINSSAIKCIKDNSKSKLKLPS